MKSFIAVRRHALGLQQHSHVPATVAVSGMLSATLVKVVGGSIVVSS